MSFIIVWEGSSQFIPVNKIFQPTENDTTPGLSLKKPNLFESNNYYVYFPYCYTFIKMNQPLSIYYKTLISDHTFH